MGDAKCIRYLVRRHAIGHQRRDSAILRDLGVDGAQINEPTERIIGGMVEVYAVRHGSSVACG
jgi:hypothetical protein